MQSGTVQDELCEAGIRVEKGSYFYDCPWCRQNPKRWPEQILLRYGFATSWNRSSLMKNLVLCCDGTANEFAADRTNVIKMFAVLVQDPVQQAVFYHSGLG